MMPARKMSQSDRRRYAAQQVLDRVKVLHHFGCLPDGVGSKQINRIAARPERVRAMHRSMVA